MTAAGDSHPDYTNRLLLAALFLVACCARFYGLDIQSLWNDELSAWARSNFATLGEMVEHGLRNDRHPPGYRALMWAWINHLGDSPVLLRLPSALAGSLCVPLAYLLGRELFSNREGLLCAALFSVSWAPVYYSQEATGYSLLLMAILLSSWLAIRLVSARRARWPWYLSYYLAAIATSMLHYYGLPIVALQLAAMSIAALRRQHLRLPLMLCALALVATFSPWLPYLMHQLSIPRSGGFPAVNWDFFAQLFLFAGHQSWLWVAVFGASVACALVHRRRRPDPASRAEIALIAWIVIPTAGLVALTLLYQPVLAPRHLIIVLPAVLLLVSRGLTALVPNRFTAPVTLAIVLALGGDLLLRQGYYTAITKQQFREVAVALDRAYGQHPGALVLTYVWSSQYLNYYLERQGSDLRVRHSGFGREKHLPRVHQLVESQRPSTILYATAHRRARNAFVASLVELGSLQKELILEGATFRVISLDSHVSR